MTSGYRRHRIADVASDVLAAQCGAKVAVGCDRPFRHSVHELVHLLVKAGTYDALRAVQMWIVWQGASYSMRAT